MKPKPVDTPYTNSWADVQHQRIQRVAPIASLPSIFTEENKLILSRQLYPLVAQSPEDAKKGYEIAENYINNR